MPTFEKCDSEVTGMAKEILREFESHKPVVEAEVKIDFVFAFADKDDDTGEPKGNALTAHGVRALGITRKISLKDRALGRGDAEIALDGDWWHAASPDEKRALLDHELHHIQVKGERDDLGRPILKLRKHTVQIGWFGIVAQRHGRHSQEQIQAAQIMDAYGQYFWPDIADAVKGQGRFANLETDREHTKMTITAGGKSVEVTSEQLAYAAKNPGKVISAAIAARKTTKD